MTCSSYIDGKLIDRPGRQDRWTYDANGNLTSDGGNAYFYDIENRLESVSGARTATLSYDPLGRLWRVSSPTSGTTDFLYDGDALIAEYNGATLLRRYVHNAGADQPFATYDASASGAVRFLFADHQGSIIATTDASGNVIAANSYDEYGIPAPTNTELR